MKAEKSLKRQKTNYKKRYGMRVSGKSTKQLPEIMAKHASEARQNG
jgi:hypothetical protein